MSFEEVILFFEAEICFSSVLEKISPGQTSMQASVTECMILQMTKILIFFLCNCKSAEYCCCRFMMPWFYHARTPSKMHTDLLFFTETFQPFFAETF